MTNSAETEIQEMPRADRHYFRYGTPLLGMAFCAGISVVNLLCCGLGFGEEQQATLRNGESLRGQCLGKSADTLRFVPRDARFSKELHNVQRITFPASLRVPVTTGPARRMQIQGGETFTGQVLALTDERVQLSLPGKNNVDARRAGLAGIQNPPGSVSQVYEDFERLPTIWKSAAGKPQLDQTHCRSGASSLKLSAPRQQLTYPLPLPVAAGRVEFSYLDDSGSLASEQWLSEFVFDTKLGDERIRIVLGGNDPHYAVESIPQHSFNVQKLVRRAGWHQVTFACEDSKLLVLIDRDVLASGPASGGVLKEVRILQRNAPAGGIVPAREGNPVPARKADPVPALPKAPSPELQVWIDDFKVEKRTSSLPVRHAGRPRDMLVLLNGDELFGTCQQCDIREVTLQAAFGVKRFPWSEIQALLMKRQSYPCAPVSGWIVKVVFQPLWGAGSEESEWLLGALQDIDAERLVLDHPWLGRLALPLQDIQRIEPYFLGDSQAIDLAEYHLGDEVREDFRHPPPDGPELLRTFNLERLPATASYLSLLVDNLEPAGAGTPAGSPFLTELQAGHLRTELYLNDQLVDDLNRHVTARAPALRPERVRVPIPAKLLRIGANQLRLRQRPSAADAGDFDDCSISHLMLEQTLSPQPK